MDVSKTFMKNNFWRIHVFFVNKFNRNQYVKSQLGCNRSIWQLNIMALKI